MVRLLGNLPCEDTTETLCSPVAVAWNEVIVLLPALTTNTSLPPAVLTTSSWVSRNGQPPGGVQPGCGWKPPAPPVGTDPARASLPLAKRLKIRTRLAL